MTDIPGIFDVVSGNPFVGIAIGLGMVISLLLTESVGVTAGGLIAPGYIALSLHNPIAVIITFFISLLTLLIVNLLSKKIIIYGKRRLVFCILISFILGFIGLAGIPLDIMTITIAAITIGIAVDNTIHYLYKARDNISKKMSINESLKNSHQTVGQAVLTTSLTIAFGFSVLCLSNFIPTILFGLFTALAMIIAMLGVLITLPACLLRIKL